jgi:putative tricarboxylic transport membrane protein
LDPASLLALVWPALLGAGLGTLVGVLPGIGPAATMALLLPASFAMDPSSAIVLLCGVYFGSQYGSSTTAILLNIPGEASGVVTAEEGHRMALDGRAGAALAIAALSSLVAGLLTALFVWVATPVLARLALALSSADIAGIVLFAAAAIIAFGVASGARGVAMLCLGVAFGFVGSDFGGGPPRFTFGIAELRDGIGLVPIVVGLFGIGEVLANHAGRSAGARLAPVGRLWPKREDLRVAAGPALRGTVVGTLVGVFPGGNTLLAAMASQAVERRLASDRARYGKGAVSGVAGPEAANNAAAQAGLVPLIGLGLPGNPVMAVMLGAFMLHGVPPGPVLFSRAPEVFEAIVAGMVIANLALVVLNLPLVGLWVRLLKLPLGFLVPIIVVVAALGTYAQSRAVFDVWLLLAFGALGFALKKAGFPLAPIVFGAVLGPLFEDHARRAFLQARGDAIVVLSEPLVLPCLAAICALCAWRLARGRRPNGAEPS